MKNFVPGFEPHVYGQLAFGLAAGIVSGVTFLEPLVYNGPSEYVQQVLQTAKAMEPDVIVDDVRMYLYDLDHNRTVFDDIHLVTVKYPKSAAIACADFFLRANDKTADAILNNVTAVMTYCRLYEKGVVRTMTRHEVGTFIDQVNNRQHVLQNVAVVK